MAGVVPGAGGEGRGERCDESRQETERIFSSEAEVDERQDDAPVDNVTQDGGEDVLPQTSDQENHVLHLHDLTAHQEHDPKGYVPEEPDGEQQGFGGGVQRKP